ncbi:MAG: type I DNA topoisomerase [Thermodesulfovibrionales bacterium]
MKSLVIVESPAKANTINKILGKGFSVKASIGHIKDLPKNEMGVDVENEFEPKYEIIPGKEKIIKELRKAAKEADRIYLAPDPDREGEAIAWHIATEISDKKNGSSRQGQEKIFRVTFNEITERAVLEAIKNPGSIDLNKVNAQQARRILDRLVGYGLSPLLWRKIRRGLSAGRVQSVAVKLIVDREREIKAFEKEEYWNINLRLEGSVPPPFWARLNRYRGENVINRDAKEGERFLIRDAAEAEKIASEIGNGTLFLTKIEKKERKRAPNPPFITSTLQQEASRKLRFTAKKTMMLAQQLYEGVELGKEGSVGLITYMRTDSVRIAPEAQEWARRYIEERFGREYLPEKPPQYKSKAGAQEAHEAIRPTGIERPPESLKQYLSRDLFNLYNLIWNRFIASQMAPARLEQTTFIIGVKGQGSEVVDEGTEIRASGTVVRFDGFMALYTEGKDEIEEEEGGFLPPLKTGEELKIEEIKPTQHFTQPPPRYTEATLVKALEEKGIGRPSTYATILSTIQDRKYVHKVEGRFEPTELGILVNDFLVERFPELIDVGFTAKMEDELDRIEEGKMKWVKVVKDFYKPFSHDLAEATKMIGKIKPADIPTEIMCEKCGLPMVIRWGRHGRFLACSGYPTCKNAKPLDENGDRNHVVTDQTCSECGAPLVVRSGRFGKFLACSRYPECKFTKPLSTGVKCPLDGGEIIERKTRKGRSFWSCSNYPKCKFATWYKPVSEKCPSCGADFLLEKKEKDGGIIHFCNNKGCNYKSEPKFGEWVNR